MRLTTSSTVPTFLLPPQALETGGEGMPWIANPSPSVSRALPLRFLAQGANMSRMIGSQRSNGFASMIKQMKLYALAYKTKGA